jgi:natural product biosynthesis luciferase-like monooxygenase protein
MNFKQLLTVLKDDLIADFKHGEYPIEKITGREVDELRNLPLIGMIVEEIQRSSALDPMNVDILFSFGVGDSLGLTIRYSSGRFDDGYISKMAARYFDLLERLIVGREITIGAIDLITAAEKDQILHTFNDTAVEYPSGKTVVSLFQDQVRKTPEKVAVVCEGKRLTYRELDIESNRLAHYLRSACRVRANDLVVVMADRSERLPMAMLAVLKAGGAYVPIDAGYPAERISYMLSDSRAGVVLVNRKLREGLSYEGLVVDISGDSCYSQREDTPEPVNTSQDLCYVIYTSGSTGKPKGVMIAHYNVVNFFTAMNRRLPAGPDDCMLAVTSTSFDISALELLWTLCRGIEVVIHPSDISLSGLDRYVTAEEGTTDFSLFFFSSYTNRDKEKYRLLLDAVKYADEQGFKAVWTPERHFHEFGGLYPNPSVMSAALAMITRQIELRSGSVVSPLHDAVRIAEEWSVVDNLSGGRIALSFASGWNPNDFALSGVDFKDRQKVMYAQIEEIRGLWKGGSIKRVNGLGQEVELQIFPHPVQKELPVWVTAAGHEETFRSAGAIGANLLTHLLGQDIEKLAANIGIYRQSRLAHGYDKGKVTLMLHTYIGEDMEEVERLVEKPFIEYLKSSIGLARVLHEAGGLREEDIADDVKEMILKNAFKRYFKTGSLIGTVESCHKMMQKLQEIGVDEAACLIDFGIEQDKVLQGLEKLKVLKELHTRQGKRLHRPITMMQSTPSLMKLLQEDKGSGKFIQSLRLLLVGGEAVTLPLIEQIGRQSRAAIYNMYGPTETTIWSCVYAFGEDTEKVSIGQPIANTQIYILNKDLQLLPVGIAGDLYIGGQGVSPGYWGRPELTAERFIPDPFNKGEKIYRTGDVAKWLPDGNIEFAGRQDHQVKIRGYRIELEEIEHCLLKYKGIKQVIVHVKEEKDGGGQYLVGYIVSGEKVDFTALAGHLAASLPLYMIPGHFVQLESLPLTQNGKVDRKSLPDPEVKAGAGHIVPRNEIENTLAEIWAEVLNIEKEEIGIHSNFFQLGGHSINIHKVARLINEKFNTTITLADMFRLQTIKSIEDFIVHGDQEVRKIAGHIEEAQTDAAENLLLMENLFEASLPR